MFHDTFYISSSTYATKPIHDHHPPDDTPLDPRPIYAQPRSSDPSLSSTISDDDDDDDGEDDLTKIDDHTLLQWLQHQLEHYVALSLLPPLDSLDSLRHGNYMLCLIHRFGSVPTLVTLLEQQSNLEWRRLAETLAQRFWDTALDSLPCFLYHQQHHHHHATTIGEFVDHLIVPSSPRVPPPETLTKGVHHAAIHTTPGFVSHTPCWVSTTHHTIHTYQQRPSTQHYLALLDILQQLQSISVELLHWVPDGRLPFLEQHEDVGLPTHQLLDRLLTTLTTQTYDTSWYYLVDLLTQRTRALQARLQTPAKHASATPNPYQQQWHALYAAVSAHVADLHQKVRAFSSVDDWHDLARQVHAARHGNQHKTLMRLYHRLLDSEHTQANYETLARQWQALDEAMDTARRTLYQEKQRQAFLRHCAQIETDAMDLEHHLVECRQEGDDGWMKMWVADLDETITRVLQWAVPGTEVVCAALTRWQASYHQAWGVYRTYRRRLQRALALDALGDRVTGCLDMLGGGDLMAWKRHYSQLRVDVDAWFMQHGQGVDTVAVADGLLRIQQRLAALEGQRNAASAWRATMRWAKAVAVSISDVVRSDREPNQQAMDNYTHALAQAKLLVEADDQQCLDQQAGELTRLFHAARLVVTQRKRTTQSIAHLAELQASSQLLSERLTAALQASQGTMHDSGDFWYDSVIQAWHGSQPHLSPTSLVVNDLVRWEVLMAFDAILAHHVCCLAQAHRARLLWETQWHKEMDRVQHDDVTDDDDQLGLVKHLFATLQHLYPIKIPLQLGERQRALEGTVADHITRRRTHALCMETSTQVKLACDQMQALLDQDIDVDQWAAYELQQERRLGVLFAHHHQRGLAAQAQVDALQQRHLARNAASLQQQFIVAYHHSASVVETRLQQGKVEGYDDVRALCRLIQLFGTATPEVLAQQARLDALWHSLWPLTTTTHHMVVLDQVEHQVVSTVSTGQMAPLVHDVSYQVDTAKHLLSRMDNILQDMACSEWRLEVWYYEVDALERTDLLAFLGQETPWAQQVATKWQTVKSRLAAMTTARSELLAWQQWEALVDLVDGACRRAWLLVFDNNDPERSLSALDYEIRPLMWMKAAALGPAHLWLDVAGVFERWDTTLRDLRSGVGHASALAQYRMACGAVGGYLDAMERNLGRCTDKIALDTRHRIYRATVDAGLERVAAALVVDEGVTRLMARRDRLEQQYRTPRRCRKISLPCHFSSSTAAWVASSRQRPNAYIADPRSDLDMEIGRIVNRVPYKVELEMMPGEAGRYRFGDKIVYCRILKSRLVMVRVGGGKSASRKHQ